MKLLASALVLILLWNTDRVLSQATLIRMPCEEFTITNTANCNADESQLRRCFPSHVNIRSQQSVAGVICKCRDGEIRLVDGANYREGRVEVCVDRRWGTVCDEDWTEEEARLVYRRLGLPTMNAVIHQFGGVMHPTHSLQCNHTNCAATPSTCGQSEAGVKCLGFDEACSVTVEEQQHATTQPPPNTSAESNTAITGLGAVTGMLSAALLAVVISWIGSCVYLKR